ncbi:hypothetical protein SAMD00019534_113790 [Acytostelium subglobosum LB1]|uniref:hypothetical protein n=1 Tax=Acytostelium subglobosum LB1 TaxID=1410327 RepID=UPI0006450900|nr:hypothetical protein SAMD00019534_113790 [Acytostelium subglobosum LB1]GAM28203.1 hypothetical protein SAMD00019534_113790 [Acytostelium subglobosum LB1]|eukprot:XP_012748837.1 hypothetical protein SAMD00019534_113790 [Acytostelium subglobosum LB1]
MVITKHSVRHDKVENVQYLLDHNAGSMAGNPRLTLSILIRFCFDYGSVEVFKDSLLISAGHTHLIKYITEELKDDINISIDLESSDSLLQTALVNGHMDMAEHLLELITRSQSGKDKRRMQDQLVDDIHKDLKSTSLIERLSKHQGVRCMINVKPFKRQPKPLVTDVPDPRVGGTHI